jgi:hypothetical protein
MEDLRLKISKLQARIDGLKSLNQKVSLNPLYETKEKKLWQSWSDELVTLTEGKGTWIDYKMRNSLLRDLPTNIISTCERMIQEYETWIEGWKKDLLLLESQPAEDPLKLVLKKINKDEAELIGEGPWIKDGAYRVYKVDGKFYTIIVYDWQNLWLMDDTLEEIKEEEIENYI